jgi:hypothetical protein
MILQVHDGPPGELARRPSSFLLIPVGQTGRDLHLDRHSCSGCLFAQRADIGRNIGGFGSAQQKIRHLRVGIEQKESHLLRRKV